MQAQDAPLVQFLRLPQPFPGGLGTDADGPDVCVHDDGCNKT